MPTALKCFVAFELIVATNASPVMQEQAAAAGLHPRTVEPKATAAHHLKKQQSAPADWKRLEDAEKAVGGIPRVAPIYMDQPPPSLSPPPSPSPPPLKQAACADTGQIWCDQILAENACLCDGESQAATHCQASCGCPCNSPGQPYIGR